MTSLTLSHDIKAFNFSTLDETSPTDTVFACEVDFKAVIAGALVRPQHVLTHSILAHLRVEGALVNIWEGRDELVDYQRKTNQYDDCL